MAEEAGDPSWPWAKDYMGPPGGPEDSWKVYNGSLYLNFRVNIMETFFENADENIAEADARWTDWYGELNAGPFNTDCLAETWDEKNCKDDPQIGGDDDAAYCGDACRVLYGGRI